MSIRKKKKLNKAPLDVWGQHLLKDENTKLSERIIELDSKSNLTSDEEQELNMLLKMEAGLLNESISEVVKNKKILSKYYECLDKIKNDERLTLIFNLRFGNATMEESIKSSNDVIKLFASMMEEDMEIEGHEKLKEEYKDLKNYIDSDLDPLELANCDDPECLYCTEITEEEYKESNKRLAGEGYYDSNFDEEDKMIKLMTQILRLENILEQYQEEDEDDDE